MQAIHHEYQLYEWLDKFPDLTSSEGQRILQEKADEIFRVIYDYFNPNYMERSDNAKSLESDIMRFGTAYANRHNPNGLKNLGSALRLLKTGCQYS